MTNKEFKFKSWIGKEIQRDTEREKLLIQAKKMRRFVKEDKLKEFDKLIKQEETRD